MERSFLTKDSAGDQLWAQEIPLVPEEPAAWAGSAGSCSLKLWLPSIQAAAAPSPGAGSPASH